MKPIHAAFSILSLVLAAQTVAAGDDWRPARGRLMTRWAKDVSPKNAHPEYPRPQMVRKDWQNLNGLWDYAITDKDAPAPKQWAGKILVPFPIQSALSGVMTNVSENQRLWYSRKFEVPKKWSGKRVMLNFGAVDWETTVWVNGREVGKHQGGYDGFSFDITDALHAKSENEIVVSVWDPTDAGPQPRGKQVRNPHSIWYTPTSGIWQTVWLEPVNEAHIERIQITTDIDLGTVTVRPLLSSMAHGPGVGISIRNGFKEIAFGSGIVGEAIRIPMKSFKKWTPETPQLYDIRITLFEAKKQVDKIKSYFAMRKISMARDNQGRLRIQLNNKPYFQLGPLDQGFWPDGLYTAPTDEALRYDIEVLKKLGFNMARKHVKVEPERWYYWCDKLGLLVWQDMPSGDKSARWQGPSGFDGEEMKRTPESAAIYEKELRALIEGRYNHPCIVTWVPFNEGWGQFDTARILNLTKQLDPTRLVDGASGGNDFPAGDILDHHQYPGPGAPKPVTDRAMVLGEFGGLGLPVKGHTWQEEKNWGYRSFKTSEELTDNYVALLGKLQPMIEDAGLSAAIYTQTTDVEVEVNGLMTYDRALVKMNEAAVADANKKVYVPTGKDEVRK
ncbi:MAG TPA: glycoside hydrolase family 2 TIM barrel-domain containing protein [Candidatus Angelobacter sp.]|nr:glycoside hydrolase family 2 TIM barrel-domain containing protein [Candidatus Angelobacter sp.]